MLFIDNAVLVAQLQKCHKFDRTLKMFNVWPFVIDSFYYPRVIIFILLTEWQKYYGIVQKVLVFSDCIHVCWLSVCLIAHCRKVSSLKMAMWDR